MATGDRQLDFGFAKPPCAHLTGTVVRWHQWARGGGWHLGRFCVDCGRWRGWIQQSPETLAWAPPRPPR